MLHKNAAHHIAMAWFDYEELQEKLYMNKLIRFQAYSIIHSVTYFLFFMLIILSFIGFNMLLNISDIYFSNYIFRFDYFEYFELALIILTFCEATYFFYVPSNVEKTCLYTSAQIIVSKAFGIFLSTILFCSIPFVYCVVCSFISHTNLAFSIRGIVYSIIRWIIIIISTQSCAMFCANYIKSKVSYIVCLPACVLLSFLNSAIIDLIWKSPNENIKAFFNTHTFGNVELDFVGVRLDLFLLTKLAYVIFGALFCLSIIYFIKYKKKLKPFIVTVVCAALFIVSIASWKSLYPEEYDNSEKLFSGSPGESSEIELISCNGYIELNEFSSFDCVLTAKRSNETDSISFQLDDSLKISSVEVNGISVPYTQEQNIIKIDVSEIVDSELKIHFIYDGRIYYSTLNNAVSVFTSKYSSALPANLHFLPTPIGENNSVMYDLNVKSCNDVVSNLNVTTIGNNTYKLEGKSTSCTIFSGYFSSYEQDGTTFYIADFNRLTDFNKVYSTAMSADFYFDAISGEYIRKSAPHRNKVFIVTTSVYGVIGYPIVYDDYMFIDSNVI